MTLKPRLGTRYRAAAGEGLREVLLGGCANYEAKQEQHGKHPGEKLYSHNTPSSNLSIVRIV